MGQHQIGKVQDRAGRGGVATPSLFLRIVKLIAVDDAIDTDRKYYKLIITSKLDSTIQEIVTSGISESAALNPKFHPRFFFVACGS